MLGGGTTQRNGWICPKIGKKPFPFSCFPSRKFLCSCTGSLTSQKNRAGNEPWTFSGEDIRVWERLFTYTLDKALDSGTEPGSVLEEVAAAVLERHRSTWTSATRITDLIISKLATANLKETSALRLANQTLMSAYPATQDTVVTTWLIRSVTRVVEGSPAPIAPYVLDQIQDGLSLWFADENSVFSAEEYEYDVCSSAVHPSRRSLHSLARF